MAAKLRAKYAINRYLWVFHCQKDRQQ
nr:unnamed protein product [Callosobruchus chinensis]